MTESTPFPAFDLIKARNGWQPAVAEYDAASERYLAMCREMDAAARAAAAESCKHLAKVYAEEDKLAVVMDKQDDAASDLLAAPTSIEALQLKLSLFKHLWTRERRVSDEALDGGDVADVGAGIALELLTLLRRGDGGLAEIAQLA